MKIIVPFILCSLLLPTLVFSEPIDGQGTSLDSNFSTPTNFTDQQMDDAQNFVHQGIKDQRIQEGCAKVNDCTMEENGLPLEQMIGKAYAMIGIFTGDGMVPKLVKKPETPSTEAVPSESGAPQGAEAPVGAEGEQEQMNDYCMMAAMAWETLGGFIQNDLQSRAQNSNSQIEDLQLQSLVNLRDTHKARAKTASLQRTVYGTVTTCYVAMGFMGASVTDWRYLLKLGGASALTLLYNRKVNKHKDAAQLVQNVIDSLPKTGECNPWTGTSCFCSEKTSQEKYPTEFQEVCVLNAGNFETPKIKVGCGVMVDNKIQYDTECKCKKNNSCLKTTLRAFNPKFPFGNNLMNEVNKNFDLLGTGDFDQGKLDDATTNAMALANRFRPKSTARFPKPNLNPEQQKIANGLRSVLPPELAAIAAASNSPFRGGIKDAEISTSSISSLSSAVKEKVASAISGGYRTRGSGVKSFKSKEPEFVMPKLPGMSGNPETSSSVEVVSFAEQAISKADVSNAPTTPIFDIISNRYRRSGWKKLEAGTK